MILKDIVELKSEYYKRTGKKLNLIRPKTFNEKLQWLKLFYKDYRMVICSDKLLAKKYLKYHGWGMYLPKTILVCDEIKMLNEESLPNECIIKTTHGSGNVMKYDADNSDMNFNKIKRMFNIWINQPYWNCMKEWAYNVVKPRIFVEEYLQDSKLVSLVDYKFMCFNGKCKLIFLVLNREKEEKMFVDFYDTNWNKLPFKRKYHSSKKVIQKPQQFEKMIEIAETISKDFPFLRVDFYIVNNKLYIGELTFFPGSGWEVFEPEYYDNVYGDLLKLPNIMQCISKYIQYIIFYRKIKQGEFHGLELWNLKE